MCFLFIQACGYKEIQKDAALHVCIHASLLLPLIQLLTVTEQGDRLTHCFQDSFSGNSISVLLCAPCASISHGCSLASVLCYTFICVFMWIISVFVDYFQI